MIVRALNDNQDWTFGRGKQNYITDNPAVAQSIETRLRSFLGDCFFDMQAGVDWFTFLGGSKDLIAFQLGLSAVILNSFGVLSIKGLNIALDANRLAKVTFDVLTIFSGSIQRTVIILTDEQGNILTDESGNALAG